LWHTLPNKKSNCLSYTTCFVGLPTIKDKPCFIDVTITPNDASFKECEYQLTISRDGYDLDEESIKEIAYFNDEFLEITDKAESGDLIYVQVINKRDPQVKSDIIEITVY